MCWCEPKIRRAWCDNCEKFLVNKIKVLEENHKKADEIIDSVINVRPIVATTIFNKLKLVKATLKGEHATTLVLNVPCCKSCGGSHTISFNTESGIPSSYYCDESDEYVGTGL